MIFAAILAATPFAQTVGDAPSSAAVERSPGDITVEQRTAMMTVANDYNNCVYHEAIEHINADGDIRRIADLAMGACQDHLNGLREKMTGWGYPAYFSERFTRNVGDRAARKLLPELAIRKSQ